MTKVEVKNTISGKTVFLPKELLVSYGCRNCVWKHFGQCPKGFTLPTEWTDDGYCMELAEFIVGLAEKDDSISAIKEKFHLYTQEIQVMADNTEYHNLLNEYKRMRAEGANRNELAEIEMQLMTYKMWWGKLSEAVVKGLSRIADREKRQSIEPGTKMSVQQLNVLINDSTKKLMEYEGKDAGKEEVK